MALLFGVLAVADNTFITSVFSDRGASKFITQINRFCVKAATRAIGGPSKAILELSRRIISVHL